MSLTIARFNDVPAQRWRNGGGVTRELLAWPSSEHWVLRLSVADIEQDGPFSSFPGVDRWFAVLSGHGVRLGTERRFVTATDGPFRFEGESAPSCELVEGPTRDLNLMVKRGAGDAWMTRAKRTVEWPRTARLIVMKDTKFLCGLFTLHGCELRTSDFTSFALEPMTVAWQVIDVEPSPWHVLSSHDDGAGNFVFGCELVAISGDSND